jgi:hypothetical protein
MYKKSHNKWLVKFPFGILTDNKRSKLFKSEEEARSFVLELIPDAYDVKIETERFCTDCKSILPIEAFKTKISSRRMCRSCKSARSLKVRQSRVNKGFCKTIRLIEK